ncbi:hypothetical protein JTE90_027117 [Oedothorax gibbosus]|uniref:WAP domain-containing protein n=1 Tax=Oedothorax gibbosus TaxID=931172 RepID=A0AAV6U2U2_9ARAC|nr:hypothetical protein JTE90_027117 [Oedothorax gibbosus]
MMSSSHVFLGLLIVTICNQVNSLMWNRNPSIGSNYQPDYNTGSGRWRDNYRYYDGSQPYGFNTNSGFFGNAWNFPSGNTKGSYRTGCYDSRQCSTGQCCQISSFSAVGTCTYAGYSGCSDRTGGWFQRPGVYPGNNKGGQTIVTQFGRPGTCPPQQPTQGQLQYCRQDEHCPDNQKCCYLQGNSVCRYPIFH